MKYRIRLFLAVFFHILFIQGQTSYSSEHIEIQGVNIHYLDFGGQGLPLILLHSEAWDAYTYKDFGSKLKQNNRVLAITRPGYGESDPTAYDVASQVKLILAFSKALGFEKAVYCGNGSTTAELTYLGINHSEAVAGLIYLNGLATPWLNIYDNDPHRAWEMFKRASPGFNDKKVITNSRKTYRPRYHRDSIAIEVPALALVNRNGNMGTEEGIPALVQVGSPLMASVRESMADSPVKKYLTMLAESSEFRKEELAKIKDDQARQFFIKLADAPAIQKEIFDFHKKQVLLAQKAEQKKFKHIFGKYLKLVKLDVDVVVGYEYRDNPQLILSPILDFLERLN